QPLRRVLPVPHVAAAPIALDQPLVALAVAGRAADIRREHRDTAADEVLVDGAVDRTLLRLGPAVDRDDDRDTSVRVARAVQPRGDPAPVEARIADQLDRGELVLREAAADPTLGNGARRARRR